MLYILSSAIKWIQEHFLGNKQSSFDEETQGYENRIKSNPENAENYYNLAKLHLERLKYLASYDSAMVSAKDSLQKAIKLNPSYVEAYLELGKAQLKEIQWERYEHYQNVSHEKQKIASDYEAQEDTKIEEIVTESIKKAIKIKPDFAEAYYELAYVYDSIITKNYYSKMVEALERAVSIKPDYFEAYRFLAIIHADNGECEKAVECYEKTVLDDKLDAYSRIANMYYEVLEYDKAYEHYQKCLELDSRDFEREQASLCLEMLDKDKTDHNDPGLSDKVQLVYKLMDKIEELLKDRCYDRAVRLAKRTTVLKPQAETYYTVAQLYYYWGNNKLALEYFDIAVSLNHGIIGIRKDLRELITEEKTDLHKIKAKENPGMPYFLKGISHFLKDEIDEAIAAYKDAIEMNSRFYDAYTSLAGCYRIKGEIQLALSTLVKAVDIDPDKAEAYYQFGMIHSVQKEYTKAISFFKKAIELKPDHESAIYELGYACHKAYYKISDDELAIEYMKKVLDLNPNNYRAQTYLGYIYYQQCVYEPALTYINKSLEINPEYHKTYLILAGIYEETDQSELSYKFIEKALELDSSGSLAEIASNLKDNLCKKPSG